MNTDKTVNTIFNMKKTTAFSSDYQLPWQQHPIAMRVYNAMAYKPYCGEGKIAALIRHKKAAVQYPYLVLNPPTQIYWLTFDLDHCDMMIWQSENLPCPNFVVRDPHTGKGHITYALESVCISPQARTAPMRYLAAIKRTMTRLLKADTAYNNRVTKNPFHPYWKTTWLHHKVFSLRDLHEHLPTLDAVSYHNSDDDSEDWVDIERRNCSVFNKTRYWAYRAVELFRQNSTFKAWQASVLQKVQSYARQAICPRRGCLSENEIAGIARSIAKWCWHHYQDPKANIGKLQLDKNLPLIERQRLSAQHTHEQRRQQSTNTIRCAVAQLYKQGKKITQVAVAKLAGISRQQIAKHYSHLLQTNTETEHTPSPLSKNISPKTANEAPINVNNGQTPKFTFSHSNHEKNVNYDTHQVTALLKDLLKKNNNERSGDYEKNEWLSAKVEKCSAKLVKSARIRTNTEKTALTSTEKAPNSTPPTQPKKPPQQENPSDDSTACNTSNYPAEVQTTSTNKATTYPSHDTAQALQIHFDRLNKSRLDLSRFNPNQQAELKQIIVDSGWSTERCVTFLVKMFKQMFSQDLPVDFGFLKPYTLASIKQQKKK